MSSRTDTDRRAYLATRLRKYVDLMMDDDGSDTSAGADANRAAVMRMAGFYAALVGAFPPPAPGQPSPPGQPSRKLPPERTPRPPRKTTPPKK